MKKIMVDLANQMQLSAGASAAIERRSGDSRAKVISAAASKTKERDVDVDEEVQTAMQKIDGFEGKEFATNDDVAEATFLSGEITLVGTAHQVAVQLGCNCDVYSRAKLRVLRYDEKTGDIEIAIWTHEVLHLCEGTCGPAGALKRGIPRAAKNLADAEGIPLEQCMDDAAEYLEGGMLPWLNM